MKTHQVDINTAVPNEPSGKILIIYTGGTLGMVKDENGSYVPFDFEKVLERIPELHQLDCLLSVISFDEPMDSSNVTSEIWVFLAKLIEEKYEEYDGFVVLHGTDTMAYSASALSFLLENLSKPVVFTGAQLPIGELRTDAKNNFINALEVAKSKDHMGFATVPEVCIFFHDCLLRGNRAKKVESSHFDAFKSENYPILAEVGVNIDFRSYYIGQQTGHELVARDKIDTNVMVLKLFPGISELQCQSILEIKGLKGLVLETYGSGNAPTSGWFKIFLKKLIDKGVLIFNVSQCDEGKVEQGRYSTSTHFNDLGVISGKDITTEAAITKMMYMLGNYSVEMTREYLGQAIRGEME